MESKTIIIILVVLGLLFVLILLGGWGYRDDEANLDPSKSFQSLKNMFLRDERVTAAQLGEAALVVGVSATKEFEIAPKKGTRVRSMRLEMIQGQRMELKLIPKGDYGVPVSINLRPEFRRTPKLQVFEKGATLQAKCVSPDVTMPVCRLKLNE